jgi:hypothetical protein
MLVRIPFYVNNIKDKKIVLVWKPLIENANRGLYTVDGLLHHRNYLQLVKGNVISITVYVSLHPRNYLQVVNGNVIWMDIINGFFFLFCIISILYIFYTI